MASTKKKDKPLDQPLAWERQPGESIEAYTRFVAYRTAPPELRSYRKLGIALTLASRWAKRHAWQQRTALYDDYLMSLRDELGERAVLLHRQKAARFADKALDAATRAVEALTPKRTSGDTAVLLARTAQDVGGLALGISRVRPDAAPANFAVGVSFGATETPAWLRGASVKTKHNELDNNCIDAVVNKGNDSGVKVLAERVGPNRHVHALPGSPEQTGQTGPPAALTQKIKNKNKNFIKGGEPGNGPE